MHYITSLTEIPINQSGSLTITSSGDMFRAALVKKNADEWQSRQTLNAVNDALMFMVNPAWDEILVVEPSNESANIMLKFAMEQPKFAMEQPSRSPVSLAPTTNSLMEWWNKQTTMYKWIFGIAIAILVLLIILVIFWLVKKNGKSKMSMSSSYRSTPATLSYF